mgnify:CR=1 FL=1
MSGSRKLLNAAKSSQMKLQWLAAIFILYLLIMSPVDVEGRRERKNKRKHVKAVARRLAKQLAKVQHQTSKNAAKITSTMSYSAAIGICRERIKAEAVAGTGKQCLTPGLKYRAVCL